MLIKEKRLSYLGQIKKRELLAFLSFFCSRVTLVGKMKQKAEAVSVPMQGVRTMCDVLLSCLCSLPFHHCGSLRIVFNSLETINLTTKRRGINVSGTSPHLPGPFNLCHSSAFKRLQSAFEYADVDTVLALFVK